MTIKEIIKRMIRSNKLTRKMLIRYNICLDSQIKIKEYRKECPKNYVFMVPTHNNAGDVAQTVCIKEWLEENYNGYQTILVSQTAPLDEKALIEICKKVNKEDNIFIHSGFNITDVTDEFASPTVFASHKVILRELSKHRIIFFPQTVQYEDINKWKHIKEMYAGHKNIVFISRDETSYECAKQLLPNAKHLCYPDIVTSWIGKYDFSEEKSGILFCAREGDESLLREEDRLNIISKLSNIDAVVRTDTDFDKKGRYLRKHRKEIVMDKIMEFSKYKVVVTDRYHGIIFALIARRPVVILRTNGHKITSGLSWFPEEFNEYIYFVSDISDVDRIVENVKKAYSNKPSRELNKYFKENFYNKLKREIEQ